MASTSRINIRPVSLDTIRSLRERYRDEMNCQIVHDSWHVRGWVQSYVLEINGVVFGYGSVGGAPGEPRTTVKEFFVLAEHRGAALPLFRRLITVSGAQTIAAQTNDGLLSLMLHDCAVDLASDTILFSDAVTTHHDAPGMTLRRLTEADRASVFPHRSEPVGEWGLQNQQGIVATGGLFFHYNPPYGDIYMEVAEAFRRKGYGSYLVQELKRICREGGHVPAARTSKDNVASRLTLQRAGMFPCARIVTGRITT